MNAKEMPGLMQTPVEALTAILGEEAIAEARSAAARYARLMAYYRCAMMEVETKLNVLNEEFSLRLDRNPITDVKVRLKRPDSIREKLRRLSLPMTVDSIEANLSDVAGVRVICPFISDVYTLADALLSQDDVELLQKKDYIASPKPNGYRSLHLVVRVPIFLEKEKRTMRVEIQLRTIAMDSWATLEHQLRYKKEVGHTEQMETELLHCARLSEEMDARMDALRQLMWQDG